MQQAQHDLAACTKQQMVWDTSKPPILEKIFAKQNLENGRMSQQKWGCSTKK
jgi:hypothetical protein